MKRFYALLLCAAMLLVGCSTTKSFTFKVDTGDQLQIELDTTDGYNITSSVPFEISKNDTLIFNGAFGTIDDYEDYYSTAVTEPGVDIFASGSLQKGGQYFAYTYSHDGLTEVDYFVCINNTAVFLASTSPKEVAVETFSRILFTLVKGETKGRDPQLVAPDAVIQPDAIPVPNEDNAPDIGIVNPNLNPGSFGETGTVGNSADSLIEGTTFAVYALYRTGYSSANAEADFIIAESDTSRTLAGMKSGTASVNSINDLMTSAGFTTEITEDRFTAERDMESFMLGSTWDEKTEASYTVYMDEIVDYVAVSHNISELLGLVVTPEDMELLEETVRGWATEEGSAVAYSLLLVDYTNGTEFYIDTDISTGRVYISATRTFS